MDLKCIMPVKVSQISKVTYCVIPLSWHFGKQSSENRSMVAGAGTGDRDWLSRDTRELLEVMRLFCILFGVVIAQQECICPNS